MKKMDQQTTLGPQSPNGAGTKPLFGEDALQPSKSLMDFTQWVRSKSSFSLSLSFLNPFHTENKSDHRISRFFRSSYFAPFRLPINSSALRFALRLAITVLIVAAIFYWDVIYYTDYPGKVAAWVMITVNVVTEKTYTESLFKSWNRIIATVVGGGLAALVGLIFNRPHVNDQEDELWWNVLGSASFLFLFSLFATYVRGFPAYREYQYGFLIGVMTFSWLMLQCFRDGPYIVLTRAGGIILGIGIALVTALVVFPVSCDHELSETLGAMLGDGSKALELVYQYARAIMIEGGVTALHGEFDDRNDKVFKTIVGALSKSYNRGEVLLDNARREYLLRWNEGSKVPKVVRCPEKRFRLAVMDARRLFVPLSMLVPYLRRQDCAKFFDDASLVSFIGDSSYAWRNVLEQMKHGVVENIPYEPSAEFYRQLELLREQGRRFAQRYTLSHVKQMKFTQSAPATTELADIVVVDSQEDRSQSVPAFVHVESDLSEDAILACSLRGVATICCIFEILDELTHIMEELAESVHQLQLARTMS
jgi:hypothetical protein